MAWVRSSRRRRLASRRASASRVATPGTSRPSERLQQPDAHLSCGYEELPVESHVELLQEDRDVPKVVERGVPQQLDGRELEKVRVGGVGARVLAQHHGELRVQLVVELQRAEYHLERQRRRRVDSLHVQAAQRQVDELLRRGEKAKRAASGQTKNVSNDVQEKRQVGGRGRRMNELVKR
eukprot:5234856-Pleurochrysis_carterae.AAC.1